ncbi:DUF4177 domain-containing protein [Leisingera methylohalidivorans]|uniref:DUF4177 domain-containing protein n=1 Tax=Leisingera methylohalidivorans DSM 14336 TaxID=999552 RepID=V9VVI8_9RHOB|nr:DUF4177 domain-containing protein [Leisingera methylohalidivorans]AHD01375.1 hypothetical protein METH_12420 [Leisingera methylohalidivorans DSM 14336]
MHPYEYKVIPAPAKGTKAKGVKTPEARFANSVEILLNEMAADGWEFQRAELLPSEERSGLTGSTTNWRNVMVFRRAIAAEQAAETPPPGRKEPAAPSVAFHRSEPQAPPLTAAAGDPEAPPDASLAPGPGAARMQSDDGVEELSPVAGMTAALKKRAEQKGDGED